MEWWNGRQKKSRQDNENTSKAFNLMEARKDGRRHTPFTTRVPILVTKPLTLSDRKEDRARVEPGSCGASKATHSCSPLLSDARLSCSKFRSHSSSQAYDDASVFHQLRCIIFRLSGTSEFSSSLTSWSGEIGGQTAADMIVSTPDEEAVRSEVP